MVVKQLPHYLIVPLSIFCLSYPYGCNENLVKYFVKILPTYYFYIFLMCDVCPSVKILS